MQERLKKELERYRFRHSSGKLFFDTNARAISGVRRSIRDIKPELVVIDNLSQLQPERSYNNKTLELLASMDGLKEIAHESGAAIVVIHNVTAEESGNLWPAQSGGQQKKNARTTNAPPDINGIAWAKDLKNKTDILLFLVPDVAADLGADVVPLKLWVMKDRTGERLTMINLWFDRKKQWMDDKEPLP
jgi:hypothetical protein